MLAFVVVMPLIVWAGASCFGMPSGDDDVSARTGWLGALVSLIASTAVTVGWWELVAAVGLAPDIGDDLGVGGASLFLLFGLNLQIAIAAAAFRSWFHPASHGWLARGLIAGAVNAGIIGLPFAALLVVM